MKKERKEKHFIKKPIYVGGSKAMKDFIRKNLKYPAKALENKIEGTVHIKYSINAKGNVISTKVISNLGYGCDDEAVRLVKMLKFSVPKNRNMKITFNKKIAIHFKMPKESQKSSVTYTVSPATKSKKEQPKKNKNSYSYSIQF